MCFRRTAKGFNFHDAEILTTPLILSSCLLRILRRSRSTHIMPCFCEYFRFLAFNQPRILGKFFAFHFFRKEQLTNATSRDANDLGGFRYRDKLFVVADHCFWHALIIVSESLILKTLNAAELKPGHKANRSSVLR